MAPFVVAPQPPRLAESIGPLAAWVCLATYLLSSFVLHVVVAQPFVPLGVTNVVGAATCIVALLLMRRGRYLFGTRMLVIAVVGGEPLRDLILEAMASVKIKKPLAVTVMAGSMQSVAQDFPLFLNSGISIYSDAVRAAKALATLSEYARFRARWLGENKNR